MKTDTPLILAPLNGSPEAEPVLATLRLLAGRDRARVHLLGVEERPDYGGELRTYLEARSSALQGEGVEATPEIRKGRASQEILAAAKEHAADLIALTTTGRRGLQRLVEGSTAEAVLRRAEVPVLTCREETAAAEGERLLLALDGSLSAEAALPEAVAWARRLDKPLDVMQVVLPVLALAGIGEVGARLPSENPRPYLERICGTLKAQGVQARPVVRTGRATAEILSHVRENGVGLLFMGTHGRTGVPRFVLGSIAEETMRTSPCPVIVRRRVEASVPAGN